MSLVLLCCQPDVIDVDGILDIPDDADMVDGGPDIIAGSTSHLLPQQTVSPAGSIFSI